MESNQISIDATLKQALELHQGGRLAPAEALYRQILEVAPNHPDALHLLGMIAHHSGKNETAIELIKKAIRVNPYSPSFYNNLATVLRAHGRLDEAASYYQQALSIRPDYADAHNNLGNVQNELGRVDAAVASYERALALKESPEFKANFARCIENVAFIRSDPDIRRLITRAVSEPWARPADLAKASVSILRADPDIGPCIERAALAWPQRLTTPALFGPSGVAVVANDALLLSLLENAQISDPAFERFLTMARHSLLDAVIEQGVDAGFEETTLAFYCALARQCFINDYVFSCTDVEVGQAASLRESLIESLAHGEPIPASWLAAVAAYYPLLSVPGIESVRDRSWPEAVTALLRQQITEPIEEGQYRDAMPRMTSIHDDVSRSVRQQYEENPYPRWVKLPLLGATLPLDAYIRQHFPFAPMRPLGTRSDADILIAGCGTGQESNEMARQVDPAHVLGLDLSLSSLGYAQRKARELGLTNIEYAQADILQLASLGRTFDLITASGVLHHLADPMAGLRTLVSLLRPGGAIRLGLYSEAGRQAVVAARKFIAEGGYLPNAADIRRCRQDLMAADDAPWFKVLTTSRSFYVTGECRDLLFHVEEHRFTLPQIKEMLRTFGLDFLGFSLKVHVTRRFAERYPDDKTQTNLDHWHAFETEFPNTFAGMYQFLAQKSART